MVPQNGRSFLESKVIYVHVAWLLCVGWREAIKADPRAGPTARLRAKGLSERRKLFSVCAVAEFTRSAFGYVDTKIHGRVRVTAAFSSIVGYSRAADSGHAKGGASALRRDGRV